MLTIDIKGLNQLSDALMKLPTEIAQKELTNALLAGGHVVGDEMEAQAPRSQDIGPRPKNDQHIADNIVVQAEGKVIGSAAEVVVGPSKAVSAKARWTELGTTAHAILKKHKKVLSDGTNIFGTKVYHPGERPRPFMRSSLAVSANAALDAIKKSLADGIQRAAKRVKKN